MDLYIASKIRTYVGFCIKSNKVIYGVDNLARSKKVRLIFLSHEISDNTIRGLERKTNKPMIFNYDFGNLTIKQGCRAFGITSKELADRILEIYNEESKEGNDE